jgi:hypothetical protein
MGETLGEKAIRLWPPVAVVAMVLLGTAIVCVAALTSGQAPHRT